MTDSVRAIRRNAVVVRWGTPHRTTGSLNEPREREENGVRFNEKWVYRLPRPEADDPCERIVYWHRYDFVASFLVDAERGVHAENAHVFLAGLNDREYRPPHVTGSERDSSR